jgi:hypothetical protein
MNFTVNGNINFKAYSQGSETTCQITNDGFYVNDDKIKPIPEKLLKFDSECLSLLDTQLTIQHENTITLQSTNQNIHLLATSGYVILVGNVIINNRGYVPVSDDLLKLDEHLTYYSSSDTIEFKSKHVVLRCESGGSILLTGNSSASLKVNPDSIEIRGGTDRVDITGNKVDIAGDVYINDVPLPMPVYKSSVFKTNTNWTITSDMYMNDKFVFLGFILESLKAGAQASEIGELNNEIPKPIRTVMGTMAFGNSQITDDNVTIPVCLGANAKFSMYVRSGMSFVVGSTLYGQISYITN